MAQIIAYLTFNGNCNEAMSFYQKCLGGELSIQTLGESPLSEKLPPKMKKYVLHSTLAKQDFVLKGTDMVDNQGLIHGNAVSLLIDCNSEEEIRDFYENLSNGGEKIFPLEYTFWGTLFGGLKDRFGNFWLLNYEL